MRFKYYKLWVWVTLFSFYPMPEASASVCKNLMRMFSLRIRNATRNWLYSDVKSPVASVVQAGLSLFLLDRTHFWGRAAGRTGSHREVMRSMKASFVRAFLEFTHPSTLHDYLKPQFKRMHLNYTKYLLYERLERSLTQLIQELKNNNQGEIAPLAAWATKNGITDKPLLSALSTTDRPSIIDAAENLIAKYPLFRERIASEIALSFDEYEAARSMLEACKANKGVNPEESKDDKKTEDAASDRLATNATIVLDRLKTESLIGGEPISKILENNEGETPATSQLKDLIRKHPEAADSLSIARGNREVFAWLLSVSPTDAIVKLLDKSAARLPYVNHPKFRAFLQLGLSEIHIIIFYPDIALVVDSKSSDAETLKMVEIFNAGTEDHFLVTLRRRIDLREHWKRMKTVAQERDDKDFFRRMENAEITARTMGDLSPWQSSSNRVTKLTRGLLDTLITGAFLGGGYTGITATVRNMSPQAPLTPEEEEELKSLQEDAQKFEEWIKTSPEGKALWRQFLKEKNGDGSKAQDATDAEEKQKSEEQKTTDLDSDDEGQTEPQPQHSKEKSPSSGTKGGETKSPKATRPKVKESTPKGHSVTAKGKPTPPKKEEPPTDDSDPLPKPPGPDTDAPIEKDSKPSPEPIDDTPPPPPLP